MGRKRGFGNLDRLPSKNYRARYLHDLQRWSAPATFTTKAAAEAWLTDERRLIESGNWTPPADRLEEERLKAEQAKRNTFAVFADEYVSTRNLRPTTVREYERLLSGTLLPAFGDKPLTRITLADVRQWHRGLPKETPAQNAAAYRLLRSILNAAESEELIDRSPARLRGASAAKVVRTYPAATLGELQRITDAMPDRLKLLVTLAWSCGLRESELLELRRKDIDVRAGTVRVERKVEKDADPNATGACGDCGRVIGPPKTAAGVRTVHIPPPFMSDVRSHLLQHAAPGEDGLLFPGERNDHMSVRYLQTFYRAARDAAGRHDLPLHGLRKTALTLAGQENATAAELKRRAGHSSHQAMAIYQLADDERDKQLAARLGERYEEARRQSRL